MASASESSQWADPVASARDLIASLEGARRHCEAEMGALSEEREHVLRAMSRAAQLLAVRRSKIDALADQECALDDREQLEARHSASRGGGCSLCRTRRIFLRKLQT